MLVLEDAESAGEKKSKKLKVCVCVCVLGYNTLSHHLIINHLMNYLSSDNVVLCFKKKKKKQHCYAAPSTKPAPNTS